MTQLLAVSVMLYVWSPLTPAFARLRFSNVASWCPRRPAVQPEPRNAAAAGATSNQLFFRICCR